MRDVRAMKPAQVARIEDEPDDCQIEQTSHDPPIMIAAFRSIAAILASRFSACGLKEETDKQ